MAKNFCPICGTALVPGLDACPNCGRRIEPDEPDRMAEPPQAQAQDGTRDAGVRAGKRRRARSRLAGVPRAGGGSG